MGIQDRDWYREEYQRRRMEEEAAQAKAQEAAKRRRPRAAPAGQSLRERAEALGLDEPPKQPPKLWGSDWHWTIQLLVWLAIVALLAVIWRMTR